jgi:hypothetical protein
MATREYSNKGKQHFLRGPCQDVLSRVIHQRGSYVRAMTTRDQLQKICGREPQEAWRQDELIGGKLPVVK